MSLYVYCLGDELSGAAFEGLSGVGGAPVRLLSLGRLSAVVSDAREEPVAVTEENLLAHNRVNAAALAVSTPLPFRFGTRAAPERLAEYAAANEAVLAEALARVRGSVEMSVKLMEKAKGKRQKAKGKGEGEGLAAGERDVPAESGEGVTAVGRGTAFLLKKRREVLGEAAARLRAEELAAWLAAGLAGLARESAARVSPSEAIVVRAAHLVERGRVAEYRTRLRELGASRPALRLLTSGPWPPYSFSDLGGRAEARP
ncbi:MAG TPA: GvpL/GvpF family gas vesicle protein [Pyrinomonadaceae bacterium]